jgi:hypothetical protein
LAKSNINKKEARKAELEIKRIKKMKEYYEDDDCVALINGGIVIRTRKTNKKGKEESE